MPIGYYKMTSYTSGIIHMTISAMNGQQKPRNSLRSGKCVPTESKLRKYPPTCPPETGPGAASAQKRNSKFWPNGPNEYLGKVKKFQVPTSNGFLWRAEKTTRGADSAPPHG